MNKVLSIFFVSILCIVLPSCGDDKEKDEPINNGDLVGSWELISSMDPDYWEDAQFDFFTNGFLNINFNNGQEVVACKYYTKGNVLHIDFGVGANGYVDDVFEGVYEINGTIMTFDCHTWDAESPDDVYIDKLILRRK